MRTTVLAVSLALMALPVHAKKPPPKPKGLQIAARPDRIKQMHDYDVKWGLGLPIVAQKGSASEISNKWTKPFDVSPPVLEWVTDYGEAEGSAYRVRLSPIKWPDGSTRSLYTDEHKRELFKNLVGHLYKLAGKDLEKLLSSAEGQALAAEFKQKIDEGGFDFPMKIVVKG
jgi:hypothetical protein